MFGLKNFINKIFAKFVRKLIKFLLMFTFHIGKLNSIKNYLHENSFKDNDKLGEYEIGDVLKKYQWIIRKFEDPTICSLGFMHHGYIHDITDTVYIIEYGCETELKIDAEVKKVSLNQFLKEDLNYEFFLYQFDENHQNDFTTILEKSLSRIGEKKYNFLTNTCEDLCVDILIKPEFHTNYQNQIRYLLDFPNSKNFYCYYSSKIIKDTETIKKFIPCRYNKDNNKIQVFKNPLE